MFWGQLGNQCDSFPVKTRQDCWKSQKKGKKKLAFELNTCLPGQGQLGTGLNPASEGIPPDTLAAEELSLPLLQIQLSLGVSV